MKAKMKWLSIALTLCLIVSSLLVMVSAAGESTLAAEATREGIQALLTTSKDTYAEKEAIDVTLSVGNNSGANVANVVTAISAPESLTIARGSLNKTYEELSAAQLLQNKVTASLGELDDGPAKTGTGILTTVSLFVMFASAVGLLYLVVTGQIKLNKTFCLFLMAGVMIFSLLPKVQAADTNENKLEVAKKITVAGEEVTLTATVTWEAAAKATQLTRADLEAAISELAWDYYSKDWWAQYESTSFNTINYFYGGYSPLATHHQTLEDATEDTYLFTVCSNFTWRSYYEAIGMPVFGHCLNNHTDFMWYYTDTSSATEDDVDDICIMRWHNYRCDSPTYAHAYLKHEDCVSHGPLEDGNIDIQPLLDFFSNYEENLRPGDQIRLPGHMVMYVGNGWIIEGGGGKYTKNYGGYDGYEYDGVIAATTVEDYFFPTEQETSFKLSKYATGSYMNPENKPAEICVLRPLDLICVDDGDGDPSNDLLNSDYVLTGLDNNIWQLTADTKELPKTGFTIQNHMYTRMAYPMMNINRTVDVGPYGTAVKGDTITYTVEIRNQSNNEKFVTTREEGYAGQDYVGVPIVETIPENVELVSAEGATLIDGVLYWSLDVAAGEIGSVSYTVKVTGDMGDEIVSTGGWVGAIPSNRIVNTIGGKYLTEETVAKFIEFYEAGREVWNSNDGYKVSAAATQDVSHLAERIYQSAGINLDMPAMNDLLKILLKQEFISVTGGAVGHKNDTKSAWMYRVKDTADKAEDQVWNDMIINGSYFGGTYIWTENLTNTTRRVSIPRVDELVPGDIILCMNIVNTQVETEEAFTVKNWKTVIYLGDNHFASVNSDGILTAMDGKRELETILTFDVFFGMRPSQAYEDVYAALGAYTGTPTELTDADKAWASATGPSYISLGDSLKDKITAMTAENIPGTKTEFGAVMFGYVYDSALGIDINTNGLNGLSYSAMNFLLFNDIQSDSEVFNEFLHEYRKLEQPVKGYEALYNMLMYYDGKAYVDVNPDGTRNNPLPGVEKLEVGDCIILGRKSGNVQHGLIYQGVKDGKHSFLASTYSPIGGYYLRWYKEVLTFADSAELLAYLNGYVLDQNHEVVRGGQYYDGYFVLRPARGFANINLLAPSNKTLRKLTEAEKAGLAAITGETHDGNKDYNLTGFSQYVYSQVGIDASVVFEKKAADTLNSLFPSVTGGELDVNSKFYPLVVPGSYGGTGVAGDEVFLPLADFQVGDILVTSGKRTGGSSYWCALYQGGDKFLVETYGSITTMTYDELKSFIDGGSLFKADGTEVVYDPWKQYAVLRLENMLYDEESAESEPISATVIHPYQNWKAWFVLRPSKLASVNRELTADEQNTLAAITVEEMVAGKKSNINKVVPWIYDKVGISLSGTFNLSAAKTQYSLFPNADNCEDETKWYKLDANSPFYPMLLDKAYGGITGMVEDGYTEFLAKEDLKVGDIVLLRGLDSTRTDAKDSYLVALYQGDKFLIQTYHYGSVSMTYDEFVEFFYNRQLKVTEVVA